MRKVHCSLPSGGRFLSKKYQHCPTTLSKVDIVLAPFDGLQQLPTPLPGPALFPPCCGWMWCHPGVRPAVPPAVDWSPSACVCPTLCTGRRRCPSTAAATSRQQRPLRSRRPRGPQSEEQQNEEAPSNLLCLQGTSSSSSSSSKYMDKYMLLQLLLPLLLLLPFQLLLLLLLWLLKKIAGYFFHTLLISKS